MIFNLKKPLPIADVEPDEPTATMYLYGREADKTVNCNGIILPSLPEWDKETYPYAVMVYDTNKVRLVVASVPFVARETEYSWVEVYMNAGTKFEMWYGTHDNLEYLGATTTTNTYTTAHVYEHFDSWSNHDICFDNGSVFISASDPVVTYENADVTINGVGYVGAVLPPLPEWDKETYPYAMITDFSLTTLYVSKNPILYTEYLPGTGVYLVYVSESMQATCSNKEIWKEFSEPREEGAHLMGSPFWSNHDIIHTKDGSISLAASEPVPVYE